MNKRISLGVCAALVLIAVTITFTATMIFSMKLFDRKMLSLKERASMYDKIYEIDTLVRENYYLDFENKDIYAATVSGYIEGLGDPYSSYLTATQVEDIAKKEKGVGSTIGIEVQKDSSGYIVVNRVLSGSSAETAGIKVGDVITMVGDSLVSEIGYDNAVLMLEVAEGASVTITANRDGREFVVDLECKTIELPTVDAYYYGEIGYVRISDFNSLTAQQFSSVITSYISNNVRGFIFDLRGTSGGTDISVVAQMLDTLLPSGTIISGRYADNNEQVMYTSDSESSVDLPFVVMVDANTEYLAEIFAAVLKDSAGAAIVGTASAGHNTIQSIMKLTDGSGIRITVASTILPSGEEMSAEGITPDYVVNADEGFVLSGRDPSADTDAQFKKALEVANTLI